MATLIENRNARTLPPQAQEELWRRSIKMLKGGGIQQVVADDLDVALQAVGKWWKEHKEDGCSSMKKQKRGRWEGDNRFLTSGQLKLKYALWSRDDFRQLKKERSGIDYALKNMSILLQRWGFTPLRPFTKAYENVPSK